MTSTDASRKNVQLRGPYDSFRDYIAALEATGRLVRIAEMDQDRFEATGFAYRLQDKYGNEKAPAFLIERIKIDGEWKEGPVIGNPYGAWGAEAMGFGIEEITDNQEDMYRKVLAKLVSLANQDGQWEKVKPVEVSSNAAPCKEIVLTGEDVDIEKFAWLKGNPADAGRYVNSGSVVMNDPELGKNVGTYRCQIKGKTKLGLNPEPGQHGWRILMAKKRRGDRTAQVAIALSADPIIFALSSCKAAAPGEDELELAGALKGKPVEVVKCEHSDILVPAHSEMIIEGEVPLNEFEPEGPYAEMWGYLGLQKPENFFLNITAITHRQKPMLINNFMTKMRGFFTGPMEANAFLRFKKLAPSLVAIHAPAGMPGVVIVCIDKRFPGEAISAALPIASRFNIAKAIIVVDKDVNILDLHDVMAAVGSRWQPDPASLIIKQMQGMVVDPSTHQDGMTSKIVIDATRQFPAEGGPDSFPPVSRTLLEEGAPGVFELVDKRWPEYWKSFEG